MGLKDKFKEFLAPADDFDEEEYDYENDYDRDEAYDDRYDDRNDRRSNIDFDLNKEPAPKGGRGNVVNIGKNQIQVVLVKPERYEDCSVVADHLNARRTVVLNVEGLQKDIVRRILDFLTGVAYILEGNIRMVAKDTYIATPKSVDLMGDIMLDDVQSGYYR